MEHIYGPGSDPELHQDVASYSFPPVLSAQFIPTESVSPPLLMWIHLYERCDRVYGQVLVQLRMREFDELPQMMDTSSTSPDLAYESLDYHDPLQCLDETVSGLRSVANRNGVDSVVLESVGAYTKDYTENVVDLVQTFGTPLSDISGILSKSDILLTGSDLDKQRDDEFDSVLDGH